MPPTYKAAMQHARYLDGIRGFAALIVVFGHCELWGFDVLPGIDLRDTAKAGVWAFFVLSAYLLTPKVIAGLRSAAPASATANYLIARAFRIIPLYYCYISALFAVRYFSPPQFVAHLLFMDGVSQLWTMPVEMFFYLYLPVMAGLLAFWGWRAATVLLALAAALFMLTNPVQVLTSALGAWHYLIFFATGSILSQIPARVAGRTWTSTVGLLAALALTVLLTEPVLRQLIGPSSAVMLTWLFAPAWAGVIYTAGAAPLGQALFGNAAIRWLGKVSFGLYICHIAVIALIRRVPVEGLAGGWLVIAASLVLAAGAYYLIEQPGIALGRRLIAARRDKLSPPAIP